MRRERHSISCDKPSWKEYEKEEMYVHLTHSAAQQKLIHHKSTALQYIKKKKRVLFLTQKYQFLKKE